MSYKCAICNTSYVEHPGDICDSCAMSNSGSPDVFYCSKCGQNQVSTRGGLCPNCQNTKTQKKIIIEDDKRKTKSPLFPIPIGGTEKPVYDKKTSCHVEGVVRNYQSTQIHNGFLSKLFQTMFTFTPYVRDNTIQTFQVFSNISDNGMDDKCDEVIVYGRTLFGSVYDNNYVVVDGYRNRSNTIVARSIQNKTSNTTLKLYRAISPFVFWGILVLFILGEVLFYYLTSNNSTSVNQATTNTTNIAEGTTSIFGSILFMVILLVFAASLFSTFFRRNPAILLFAVLVLLSIFVVPELSSIVSIIVILYVTFKFILTPPRR